jgi:5'-nucleotidase/UDP-sugar diphosphatase
MGTKRFVVLHSNDMHGDFYAETQGAEGNLIGGLALLSGYVDQVRREEENVLYVIAGDMLQGSLIDTEFRGVSTIEIMNYLAPDVVTLGNHELDYGLAHLLFLEKMAHFPIVNANLYIKKYHKRLMRPCLTLNVAGFRVLFIGIITEDTLANLRSDEIGTFVDVEDAARAVGRICNTSRHQDIDLTVLLTHIGFEQDKKLAALLDPDWGVDLIIGGHSHTLLEQPAVVNDILIAQANVGTDQIGRFDLLVDDETNAIREWSWRLIPICGDLAEPDAELQAFIDSFGAEIDRKYQTPICRLGCCLTHPRRDEETALGNLVADILAERAEVDVALVGGGSIRRQKLGPVVALGDLRETLPFDGGLLRLTITGAQLRQAFSRFMCPENRLAYESVFQVSRNVRAVYDDAQRKLESLTIGGQPVRDDGRYTIGAMQFHYSISDKAFGLSHEELTAMGEPQVVCTSCLDVLEEYLSAHQHLTRQVEGRLVLKKAAPEEGLVTPGP